MEGLCITASREGLGLVRLRLASGPSGSALLGDSGEACQGRALVWTVLHCNMHCRCGDRRAIGGVVWRVERAGARRRHSAISLLTSVAGFFASAPGKDQR